VLAAAWLIWPDLFVIGVGLDIAGAIALAWSFAVKNPAEIAHEVLLPTRTYDRLGKGFGKLGQSLARQRAEAHVGLALLVAGFLLQLIAYLFPHDTSGFHTWRERGVALVIVAVEWLAAFAVWKLYVPRATSSSFAGAEAEREAQVERDVAAAAAREAAAADNA
jgi:hypothetical protein